MKISEIMYHPPEPFLEFIEIHNTGDAPVDLGGWSLGEGALYSFPSGSEIEAGGWALICRDRELLAFVEGIPQGVLFGNYSGALSNGGERIVLSDSGGRIEDAVEYSDSPPFDPLADGRGRSLERLCFEVGAATAGNWRASPGDGGTPLAPNSSSICPPPLPPPFSPVVIDEIHYHPRGIADPAEEYIELHNRTWEPIDLHGWSLADGVRYLFDRNEGPTIVPARGFLLVARDPASLSLATGIAEDAIAGPFQGKLSNFRDVLDLLTPDGDAVERVVYSQDGLWPAGADGLGSSLQLIDPEVSSSLPQNWKVADDERCSREPVSCFLIGNGSPVRWFEDLEGGDPGFAAGLPWYDPDFDDALNGWRDGTLAVGYDLAAPEGQPWILTASTAQPGVHSILLRFEFTLDGHGGSCMMGTPLLAADWNDGFVAWLNGVEVARRGMLDPAGTAPPFDDEYHAEAVAAGGAGQPEPSYRLVWTGTAEDLRPGRNVLAIGNYNSADSGTDLYLSARLILNANGSSKDTTPGGPSAVGTWSVPPLIMNVDHVPAEPRSSDRVAVEARVEGPAIDRVLLAYDAGSGETVMSMRDDGTDGDREAGDGLYTASIPPLPPLTLVKYRVEAWPLGGGACPANFPREGNPIPHTGYLVTDDRPSVGDDVRLFYIFTPGALHDLSCDDGVYTKGTFVDFRGRARFDVGVKYRGATACGYPKKPLRVEFNKGDFFDGQEHLDFNAGWNDKAMMREKLGFDLFRDAGVPYCETHMARVHTTGGAFHGTFFSIEAPSPEYLRRNGWENGAPLYKCYTAMLDGGTAGYEACTDEGVERIDEVGAFGAALNGTTGQPLIDLLDDRLDVEEVIEYQAVQAIIIDMDSVTKNWLLYLGPHDIEMAEPERFAIFAWDLDLTFGQMRLTTDARSHTEHPLMHTRTYPFTDQGHHGIIDALLERAPDDYYIKAFYGRMLSLLQEKFRPAIFLAEYDRYDAATISHVRVDLARWPRSWGARGTDPDFWRDDLRSWIQRRYDYLVDYLLGDNPTTSGRRFRYIPGPRLKFTEIHYHPAEDDDLEFIEIRNLESAAVDISGWDIPAIGYTFPPGSKIPAGGLIVVAKEPSLLASRSPIPEGVDVFGPYPKALDDGGADLRLRDDGLFEGKRFHPETIDLVRYRDDPPWPPEADGAGYSLELRKLSLDDDLAGSWRRSDSIGGTPGILTAEDRPPVVILLVVPGTGVAPLSVTCDASRSYDPDGSRDLAITWDFGDGTTGAGDWVVRTYPIPGVFRGSVTVHDGTSYSVKAFEVTVHPPPPVAVFSASPASGVAPLDVTFDASGSFDPGGDPIDIAWDLGDGEAGAGPILVHTYRLPGTYGGRLMVGNGTASTEKTFEILVSPPLEPTRFHRGDVNGDGRFDISDTISLLGFLFLGQDSPGCLESADADDSGRIDLTDAIFILNALFISGDPIPPPGSPPMPCGPDPSPNGIGCEAYDGCPDGSSLSME